MLIREFALNMPIFILSGYPRTDGNFLWSPVANSPTLAPMRRWSSWALWLLCVPLLRTNAAEPPSRVYRDKIQPHWYADNRRFWYRVSVGKDAYEFILVEAEKGLRQPAFDHARLAGALKEAGIGEASPQKLPLKNLEFEGGSEAVRFQAGRGAWRCDLKTYALKELPLATTSQPGVALEDGPHATRRTGEETTLTFIRTSFGPHVGISTIWISVAPV